MAFDNHRSKASGLDWAEPVSNPMPIPRQGRLGGSGSAGSTRLGVGIHPRPAHSGVRAAKALAAQIALGRLLAGPDGVRADHGPVTPRTKLGRFQGEEAIAHFQCHKRMEGAALDHVAAAVVTPNDNAIERIGRQIFRRARADGTLHDNISRS
jgi:hypothetical protein